MFYFPLIIKQQDAIISSMTSLQGHMQQFTTNYQINKTQMTSTQYKLLGVEDLLNAEKQI